MQEPPETQLANPNYTTFKTILPLPVYFQRKSSIIHATVLHIALKLGKLNARDLCCCTACYLLLFIFHVFPFLF